ncbi:MAG: translation elongation factor Ts [Verrucomicrobiota bacterium]|jgi:elongation factor Ts
MSEFTAVDVAKLREMTGAGFMDCKKALAQTKGNMDAAIDFLRKKGIASAAKKSTREAREGIIAQNIQPGAKAGVLLEINCETDFVARNETFRAFAEETALKLAAGATLASLEPDRVSAVAKIGENIRLPRFIRYQVAGSGMIAAYIHTGAKVGVLVEVGADKEQTVAHEDFKQLVRDITLQIAAGNPTVVSRDQVPAAIIAKEREIAAEQVKNKPPQAITKIVEGKLEKYYASCCLVDQGFVKRNSEVSVKEHLGGIAKQLGDEIVIRRFARFQVGETPAA